MAKDFDELYFHDRPDLTPYLIHLTKNTLKEDQYTALDNLVSILKTGVIWGSNRTGFVKGNDTAACFMDIPFSSLKYVLDKESANPNNPRYEPYGIAFTKKFGYKKNCRPVLYLSNQEIQDLNIPKSELWRVVRFEVNEKGWISWLHEREWRHKGDFKLPTNAITLVKTAKEAKELQKMIYDEPDGFKIKPRAIIPLNIVNQGLYI
ncbi:hypothetical protein [Ornithinibacillus californiensis]|uniref:hypothetical protein n=1 Tax=Ornithinibacillus californiensis TaxID=161536 RepID=UPI00064E0BD8|nr:hypothetical protein [Ornithinibacillus californiensis]